MPARKQRPLPNGTRRTEGGRRPRSFTDAQLRRFEESVAELFAALGMQMHTQGTEATPRRFVRALIDSTAGYDGDPKLVTTFATECHGGPDCTLSQVIEGPIPFYSLCEHHALPFFGRVFVGYIAHEQIIGLSKLTRLVRLCGMRFTTQERLGHEVADTLEAILGPHGVGVYVDAHHLCTQMRGVREAAPYTRTSFWRGEYAKSAALRTEFLTMCGSFP
ncbi:MAG: GTP cyclohydrolase I [Thermoplasmata archaeon]|nr:GTP cyclohydrolase I [Thermoplasmata archaeon]